MTRWFKLQNFQPASLVSSPDGTHMSHWWLHSLASGRTSGKKIAPGHQKILTLHEFLSRGSARLRQIGYVLFVCLFVLAGLCKNCSTHFHKFWWKDGSGAKEERLDFGGNPDHVTLGSGLPHLWNQLPVSFRQPCTKHPADDVTLSNSPSTYSPLSPSNSITHSLFHSRLKKKKNIYFANSKNIITIRS